MNIHRIPEGAKYTHIIANPSSSRYNQWETLICGDDAELYGYLNKDNVYVLHNDKGPAYVCQFGIVYALHGVCLGNDNSKWLKLLRKDKLKRVLKCNIK